MDGLLPKILVDRGKERQRRRPYSRATHQIVLVIRKDIEVIFKPLNTYLINDDMLYSEIVKAALLSAG